MAHKFLNYLRHQSTVGDLSDEALTVTVFSTQSYDQTFFTQVLEETKAKVKFRFKQAPLNIDNVPLAEGSQAVCVFVNDQLPAEVLEDLEEMGVRAIALRCAGYNNVDLAKALELGMTVTHVPAYSPYAVAEHAAALILTLNRHTYRVYNRVREGNFSLEKLPWGFDLHGKTVGVLGTGKIGECFCRIMKGFGCHVIGYDPYPRAELVLQGVLDSYMDKLEDVLAVADIVSLHLPLTPQTSHLINEERLKAMKQGAMLINTSRGRLVDTKAVIASLKDRHLGALGIDVYEEEEELFFHDRTGEFLDDDVLSRLMTFPNVIVTPHQGFFTKDALTQIARTTLTSLSDLRAHPGTPPSNYIMHDGKVNPNVRLPIPAAQPATTT